MNIAYLPLLVQLEDVLLDALDKQYLANQIAPSSTGEEGFFDPVDGELCGIPDWNAALKAVFTHLEEEGFIA